MKSTPHSSKKSKKGKRNRSKLAAASIETQQRIVTCSSGNPNTQIAAACSADAASVQQESNKYSLVNPIMPGDGKKPYKVVFADSLPIVSLDEYECNGDEKNLPNKNSGAVQHHQQQSEDGKLSNLPVAVAKELEGYEQQIGEAESLPNSYVRFMERSGEELDGEVEYDLDEEDSAWLSIVNERRAASGLVPNLEPDTFELLMDRLEKESYFQQQVNGGAGAGVVTAADEDAVCCICMDGECQNSNAILFCDMCNLAVHQDCYGVPYIPEGQWLCRRCLQSPSRAVDCALCPNRGGAFKETDRPATWAHVVCALWIPEVRFANTVFLEPIDSIESIPAARWRLTCCVCKRRGVGACIQCHKSNCYAAFHVTCAQQAGLCMRMRTVQPANGEPMLVQKTAYCEIHAPPDYQPSTNPADARRRAIANKKSSSAPVISIPTIPPERIREIANLVDGLPKKNQLIQRLIAYWTLKRQYRNGVPLLRRLQSSHPHPRAPPLPFSSLSSSSSLLLNDSSSLMTHAATAVAAAAAATAADDDQVRNEMYKQLKYWQCLRQDLERARLLCELVRKREKLKKQLFKVKEKCMWFELRPLESVLRILLETLKMRDPNDIFGQPVNIEEVPDYLDIVSHPMDLSTMESKIDRQEYDTIADFELDFTLMVNNCLAYNRKDTMFYRAGLKMRELGGCVIEQVRKDYPDLTFSHTLQDIIPAQSPAHLPQLPPQQQSVGGEILQQQQQKGIRKRDRSSKARANDSELHLTSGDKDTSTVSTSSIQSDGNSISSASGGASAGTVGVNRRTAVLFTRKAKARASRGQGHQRTSPTAAAVVDNEQKKESDSFRVYRTGGTDSDDVGERESQSSSCSSCSTSRSTTPERDDGAEEPAAATALDSATTTAAVAASSSLTHRAKVAKSINDDVDIVGSGSGGETSSNNKMETENGEVRLSTLQLVWAKCRGYPWYPALIIDPNTPKGTIYKGVPIPAPPEDVLVLRNNHKEKVYLVLFFDTKRTWQWLPGEKLEPLGVSQELDNGKLIESRKPTDRKAVKKAYQDALLYQKQTRNEQMASM